MDNAKIPPDKSFEERNMDEKKVEQPELRSIVRGVIEEFVQAERAKAEPAYKAELMDERKRRED